MGRWWPGVGVGWSSALTKHEQAQRILSPLMEVSGARWTGVSETGNRSKRSRKLIEVTITMTSATETYAQIPEVDSEGNAEKE